MRKVREVLRLKHALGMSYRQISVATGVGKTQAAEYVRRAGAAGLAWPLPDGLDDAELDRRLFPIISDDRARPAIDWPKMQIELARRGVTLQLLWQEYLAEQPTGYSYTRFCELHNAWRRTVSATMRQTHLAGEKLFVDWAGDTIGVIDPATGEEHRASSWRRSARPTSPTPRPAGPRRCPTGLARTSTHSMRLAACRKRWCPTI